MAIVNLPGIFESKIDGNLSIAQSSNAPVTFIIGTAAKGPSETPVSVIRPSDSTSRFGKSGTLISGMQEALAGGAENIRLFRVGATEAKLTFTPTGGIPFTLRTIAKDNSTGTDYKVVLDDSVGRLYVYRTLDNVLVFDNNPLDLANAVDLLEVYVDGVINSSTGVGVDGDVALATSLPLPATVTAVDALTLTAAGAFVATTDISTAIIEGTDGLGLSRMQHYEVMYNSYQLLQDQKMDVVVPRDTYLDDLNVMDISGAASAALAITAYPLAGSATDYLGKVYVEEVDGENKFWWYFPGDHSLNGAAVPQISPVGYTGVKGDGVTTFVEADFHEVNFAYQLADFCFQSSRDNTEMTGTVGVKTPSSFSLRDVSKWVGKAPSTELDLTTGKVVIKSASNGTGLLGNKFMSGRIDILPGTGVTFIPGHTVDGINGLSQGGFIATQSGFIDGVQVKDANEHLVDIGKYINIVGAVAILSNPSSTAAYAASGAATYAGFYSGMEPSSAPTNKVLNGLRLPFRINSSKLDLLAGQRYVMFQAKTRGIVVSDSPTAARPDSDYQRLSTMRQVKTAIDGVRRVSEPFLGEGLTAAQLMALDTAIDGELKTLVTQRVITRYNSKVTSTPQQKILGQATVEIVLVPAFELRRLTLVISLSAV